MVCGKSVGFDYDRVTLNIEARAFNFAENQILKGHLVESVLIEFESDGVRNFARNFFVDFCRS